METSKIILTLKEKATTDKVLDEVLHVFATRERTRFILTVHGLMQRMKKEGFNHAWADYVRILSLLGDLGLGKLVQDSKGRVIALKEIRITLQSLGQAVVAKDPTKLVGFKNRNKFQKLTFISPRASTDATPKPMRTELSLTFTINGNPVNVQIPDNMGPNDITVLVSRLKERREA